MAGLFCGAICAGARTSVQNSNMFRLSINSISSYSPQVANVCPVIQLAVPKPAVTTVIVRQLSLPAGRRHNLSCEPGVARPPRQSTTIARSPCQPITIVRPTSSDARERIERRRQFNRMRTPEGHTSKIFYPNKYSDGTTNHINVQLNVLILVTLVLSLYVVLDIISLKLDPEKRKMRKELEKEDTRQSFIKPLIDKYIFNDPEPSEEVVKADPSEEVVKGEGVESNEK